MGLKTINVVSSLEREASLKKSGADIIVLEDSDYFKQMDDLTANNKPRLALNSVGGTSVASLIKSLKPGGTVVTFGAMSPDKIRFPTRELIFNDIRLNGFWMDRWWHSRDQAARRKFMEQIFQLIRLGVFVAPIDTIYPLEAALRALEHAGNRGNNGKILLSGPAYGCS